MWNYWEKDGQFTTISMAYIIAYWRNRSPRDSWVQQNQQNFESEIIVDFTIKLLCIIILKWCAIHFCASNIWNKLYYVCMFMFNTHKHMSMLFVPESWWITFTSTYCSHIFYFFDVSDLFKFYLFYPKQTQFYMLYNFYTCKILQLCFLVVQEFRYVHCS